MYRANRTPWSLLTKVALVLCAALVTDWALAATPKLESIAVTPKAASISVGQTQAFTANGTFSNRSKQPLGPAITTWPGRLFHMCIADQRCVECWGNNADGELGDGSTTDSLIARPVKGITSALAVALGQDAWLCAVGQWLAPVLGGNDWANWATGPPTATIPVTVTGISTATALALGDCTAVRCWPAARSDAGGITALASWAMGLIRIHSSRCL